MVVEPSYFDRDYLAEFGAFYGANVAGYANVCRRLHFFSTTFDRAAFIAHLGRDSGDAAILDLQHAYLGFAIIRPTRGQHFGRTVLRWYLDRTTELPRVTAPSRDYHCHLAGLRFTVHGVAWQQQDQGVSACATIALWSMFHSAALDGTCIVPTTVDITRNAHRTASLGDRVFPSAGLSIEQLCEAIKEQGLAPVVAAGDQKNAKGERFFSLERFNTSCASLIRSGFPVLAAGRLEDSGHAICIVGFRSGAMATVAPEKVGFRDGQTTFVYVHDDNLGPSVRCAVSSDATGRAIIKPQAPQPVGPTTVPDSTAAYPGFMPQYLLIAVPQNLRLSADLLHDFAIVVAGELSWLIAQFTNNALPGIAIQTKFLRVHEYVAAELSKTIIANPALLATTRMRLMENVRPMSLHVGVIRLTLMDKPMADILIDTTKIGHPPAVFCHVVYGKVVERMLAALADGLDLGVAVAAY